MERDKTKRRLSLVIDESLFNRLNECFEWGEKNRAITRVLEWMCEKVERHGFTALMLFIREDDLNKTFFLQKEEEEKRRNGNS